MFQNTFHSRILFFALLVLTMVSCRSEDYEMATSLSRRDAIEFNLSADATLTLNEDTLEFCDLLPAANKSLDGGGSNPNYLLLHVDSTSSMTLVKCVVKQLCQSSVDSVGMSVRGVDFQYFFGCKMTEDTSAIRVHFLTSDIVWYKDDVLNGQELVLKLKEDYKSIENASLIYSMEAGMNYEEYLFVQELIEEIKKKTNLLDELTVSHAPCTFCLYD